MDRKGKKEGIYGLSTGPNLYNLSLDEESYDYKDHYPELFERLAKELNEYEDSLYGKNGNLRGWV